MNQQEHVMRAAIIGRSACLYIISIFDHHYNNQLLLLATTKTYVHSLVFSPHSRNLRGNGMSPEPCQYLILVIIIIIINIIIIEINKSISHCINSFISSCYLPELRLFLDLLLALLLSCWITRPKKSVAI